MDTREIKNRYQHIGAALAQRRIKDALSRLEPLLKILQNSDLIDNHYNIELSYKSMLKYTSEGISDPERQKVYNHLLIQIYGLNDKAMEELMTRFSGEYTYDVRRELLQKDQTSISAALEELSAIHANDNLKALIVPDAGFSLEFQLQLFNLFNRIWLTSETSEEDQNNLFEFFEKSTFPWHTKSLLISAIMLHLMRKWNTQLVGILIRLISHPDKRIAFRAITVTILVMYKYDNRLYLYPEILSQIKLLSESPSIKDHFQSLFIQLIRTKETEKISDKLKNEIIPEVAKIHPMLRDKLDLDNLIKDFQQEDKNPDWSEFFADSPELMNKLEELSKLQMEGADVFMTTFQMLKHFPFFNRFHNWFMPFFLEHPDITDAIKESGSVFNDTDLADGISRSGFLCNSDKYSLFMSLPHMPSFQRDMMGQMFKAELDQMADIEKDELSINPDKQKLTISNQYIQDLYRFYKVHPMNHQFENPFIWKMDFYNKWIFRQLFEDISYLRPIGEFLFRKNYFNEALDVFDLFVPSEPDNAELFQKIAYCHQNSGNYQKALDNYLKADLIKHENTWNLKKIAWCYRHLKNPEKALEYYMDAARLDENNLQTQASIGHCQLELGNFEEALKYFFKVDYLNPSNQKVWRPIAWCSFVLGKLDQAEKYYHKLLVSGENKHDLLNLGHVLLCQGKRKEAMACYLNSIKQKDNNLELFLMAFEEDKLHLIELGIPKDDIPILLDQLRYLLEE
jgi:tetratricopeptide (TPR) repeat protein